MKSSKSYSILQNFKYFEIVFINVIQKDQISAVICTYNEEKYIQKCIKSLLDSDNRINDVIVIDDHSIDSTKEKVKELNDPRVRFYTKFKKFKRGKNDSIKLGALFAHNENILMLDADIKIIDTSDMIDKLINGAELVGGIIDVNTTNGKFLSRCEACEYDLSIRHARRWLFKKFKYLNNISGAFFGIKRNKILEIEIPHYVIGEDFYITQIAIINKWKIDLSTSYVETFPTPNFKALFIQRCRWVYGFYTVLYATKRKIPLIEYTTIYYRTIITILFIISGSITLHFWFLSIFVLILYFLFEYIRIKNVRRSIEMMVYRQINFIASLLFLIYGKKWKVLR